MTIALAITPLTMKNRGGGGGGGALIQDHALNRANTVIAGVKQYFTSTSSGIFFPNLHLGLFV